MRKIAASLAFDGYQWIENPVYTLDETGKILDQSLFRPQKAEPAGTEYYNGILTPGFINAHTHLLLSFSGQTYNSQKGMADFIRNVRTIRRKSDTPEDWQIQMQIRKAVQKGTRAFVDTTNTDSPFLHPENRHIRSLVFFEFMMLSEEKIADQESLYAKIKAIDKEHRVLPALHSPYAISIDNIEKLQSIFARPQSLSSVHFKESVEETELYQGSGDLLALYRTIDNAYHPKAGISQVSGTLFNLMSEMKTLLLVHNTLLETSDLKDIRAWAEQNQQNPAFVLCPRSNDNISGLQPPWELLRNSGFPLMLGTDSLLSASSLSIFDELLFVHRLQPDIPLSELLQWISSVPAKTLGWNDLGSLKPGKTPGINLIEGGNKNYFPPETKIKALI
ncbi:MAG: amidohydrolase family protein [Bacteroidota bacterium]